MSKKMKKVLSLFLSALMIFSMTVVMSVTTAAKTSGDFYYEVIIDGSAIITGYNGNAKVLEIPSEIEGYPVTSIATTAFQQCNSLTEVKISDGIKAILIGAFSECENLRSVSIPGSVKTIGMSAFEQCKNLSEVTIGYGVETIAENAFINCVSLADITIPNSIKGIAYDAFKGTAIFNNPANWTDGILYIGKYLIKADNSAINPDCTVKSGTRLIAGFSFIGCDRLESITIPDGVAVIDMAAFSGCPNLKSVTIPESVTVIEEIFDSSDINSDLVIYGKSSSAAEKYAKENGIAFALYGVAAPKFDDENRIVTISAGLTADSVKSLLEIKDVKVIDKNDEESASNALVGTGCKIRLIDDNGTVSEYTVLVPMDVNGDGKISASDARSALRVSAKLDELHGVFLTAADADDNDKITASDARKILRVSAKLETA